MENRIYSEDQIRSYSSERLIDLLSRVNLYSDNDQRNQQIQMILSRLKKRGTKKLKNSVGRLYRDLLCAKLEEEESLERLEKASEEYEISRGYREEIQRLYDLVFRKVFD